jgi:preprotein translocase subunit YajC
MDSYMVPFAVRDALLCLVFILGMTTGIFAIVHRQRKVGILVTAGFLLLALDPASEFMLFNLLAPNFSDTTDYAIFNWAYACISAPATILGVVCLVAAIYFGMQPQQQKSDSASEDVIYSPDAATKAE